MTTTISRVGDKRMLIMNDELLERARLKVGDRVNLRVRRNGVISLTPIRPRLAREQSARATKSQKPPKPSAK